MLIHFEVVWWFCWFASGGRGALFTMMIDSLRGCSCDKFVSLLGDS